MSHASSPTRLVRAALAGTVLAFAAACGGGADALRGPNVLLVTVDCLRGDRLGAAGYARDTTPNIDALALEGERFERAYAVAPFTAPSHASILTSLDPDSHGVVFWGHRLTPGAATFGDLFAEAGYATGAFHNHPSLVSTGITRGFEHVGVQAFGPWSVTAEDFETWLDGRGERRFAAWVHLWDAHRPYGFRNYEGEGAASLRARGVPERYPYAEAFFGPQHDVRVGRHEGFYNLSAAERASPIEVGGKPRLLGERDFDYIADRYDNAVREADRGVAALLESLRERGLLDDTIVVVTADHGETLRERAGCWFTHDPYLTDETLRVPLVVRWPGARAAGRVRPDVASAVDLLPTLLDACDIEAPPSLQGRSLVEPPPPGASFVAFAQTRSLSAKESAARAPHGGWIEHRESVTDGTLRLVHDLDQDRWSLFDLVRDPGETRDLLGAGTWSPEARALRATKERLRAARPRVDPSQGSTTPEERALLQRMGYLEGDE
jgi:arylsulfatase A-like enzyme